MPVNSLRLQNFTVFEDATLELCPGVNVLLGANGTGKSHALKALYSFSSVHVSLESAFASGETSDRPPQYVIPDVFQLEGERANRAALRRRGILVTAETHLELSYPKGHIDLFLLAEDTMRCFQKIKGDRLTGPVLFLPPREVLSMYPGFTRLWEKYQLAFDRTYYDLCSALSGPLLRKVPAWVKKVTEPLEEVLGGKVVLRNDRFYILKADGDLAITLEAEGLRKLAMVMHLLHNGSIEPGGLLLWDEPEANMNPKLVRVIKTLLLGLARAGIQIVVATHDYLLTRELSLESEYGDAGLVRFFCLHRDAARPNAPVRVETGETLADLEHNPIVEEFAAHYDREAALFARTEAKPAAKPVAKSAAKPAAKPAVKPAVKWAAKSAAEPEPKVKSATGKRRS